MRGTDEGALEAMLRPHRSRRISCAPPP